MSVKAKFKCNSVTNFGASKDAQLSAVHSQTGENADFTKYTPSGQLTISINSEAPASNFFEPGKEYYLTFEQT